MRNITQRGNCARIALSVLALCLIGGPAGISFADIIYVDIVASAGGDGSNWPNAFKYLQDALHASLSSGDEIRVAGGTYYPDEDEGGNVTNNDRSATFALVDGTSLKGGYHGQCSICQNPDPRDEVSILSGDIDGDGLYLPRVASDEKNSFSVVTALNLADMTTLDGLTITMGSATGTPVNHPPHQADPDEETAGAAVFVHCCEDVQIKDCVIKDNFVTYAGAGVHANRAVITIEDTIFDNNLAQMYAGAVFHNGIHLTAACAVEFESKVMISGCTFTENRAPYAKVYSGYTAWYIDGPNGKGTGGAIAIEGAVELIINSSADNVTTFTDNYARLKAGALALFTRSEPGEHLDIAKISDVVFDSNGDWLFDVDGNGTVDDLTVRLGGGVWTKNVLGTEDLGQGDVEYTMFQDCTFKDNVAERGGGALWLDSLGGLQASVVNLDGCTFLRNSQTGTDLTFKGGGAIFVASREGGGQFGDITGTWTNCTFIENDGLRGGAVYVRSTETIEIGDSMFMSNSAGEGGGAICASDVLEVGDTVLRLCESDFIGNTAAKKGGAVYNRLASKTTMVNCIIAGNTSGEQGAGTCNADDGAIPGLALTEFHLHNCLLAGNETDGAGALADGGGHYNRDGGQTKMINCTVVKNAAGDQYGGAANADVGSKLFVQNCIMWGNTDADGGTGTLDEQLVYLADDPDDTETDKNVIEDCTACFSTGGTNKGDDPVFVDAGTTATWTVCSYDPDTGTAVFEVDDAGSAAAGHFFKPESTSPLQLLIKQVIVYPSSDTEIVCYGWWDPAHTLDPKTGTIYDYHIASGSSAIDYGSTTYLADAEDPCDLEGDTFTNDPLPKDLDLLTRDVNGPDSGAYEVPD